MFYSRAFLDELFLNKDRELNVRIDLLTWQEVKIKEIQGLVTEGSLSVDGNSPLRRTLNMSIVLDPETYYAPEVANEITISRKMLVSIGLKNNTYYGRFPDLATNETRYLSEPIIWFKLGIFVPTEVSLNHNIDDSSISISAQDKMVLLNGDVGGELGYDIDFVNTITDVDLPYQTIIRDSVSYFGGIDNSKILISDVPFYAETLSTIPTSDFTFVGSGVSGSSTISFSSSVPSDIKLGQTLIQVITEQTGEGILPAGATVTNISTSSIGISSTVTSSGGLVFYVTPALILYATNINNYGKRTFNIADGSPITSGTQLAPQLDPGKVLPLQVSLSPKNKETSIEVSSTDNVTTILEKVKSDLLGQYEYFFDIDGNFVFQFKRNLESEFDSAELFQNDSGNKYLANFDSIPYIYDFSDKEIISSYGNTPNWRGIKNDFYVYGAKNLLYHLVIDTIPKVPAQFYERGIDGRWTNNLIDYNQPWQQYIIDLTEYNAQENPDIPENIYYAELKKYFEYNAADNTGIYWKQTPTTGIWRSNTDSQAFAFDTIVPSFEVEYVVIGGGGGGSRSGSGTSPAGGGGGAGGYRAGSSILKYGDSLSLTIGTGGAAGNAAVGSSGGSSSFGTVTASGGGGGGPNSTAGASGGSGGGGGGNATGGSGTSGQGNNGGNGARNTTTTTNYSFNYNWTLTLSSGLTPGTVTIGLFVNNFLVDSTTRSYSGSSVTFTGTFTRNQDRNFTEVVRFIFPPDITEYLLVTSTSVVNNTTTTTTTRNAGGGGGGAGIAGGNGTAGSSSAAGGLGGNGISSGITGTSIARAGGGGGGASTGTAGSAGFGGGVGTISGTAGSGTVNTGGGGGGAGSGTAGAGGSGIVVLRYPASFRDITVGGGLTHTKTEYDVYKVYRFTQGSGTITF
jgi:hypothetical protein